MPVLTLKIAGMHDYSFTPSGFFSPIASLNAQSPNINTSRAKLMSFHIEMQLFYYLDGASKQKMV